jgi:ssDNA-binding Zn-finger/Zn-ribbon topoisomerase 1
MTTALKLKVKCPSCGCSLLDEGHFIDDAPSIKVSIKVEERKGWLRLSSIYGSYAIESEFEIPESQIATFFCPSCNTPLKDTTDCSLCQAPMVSFQLEEGGAVKICSRRGCKKHSLEFGSRELAMSKFYEAYSIGGGEPHDTRKHPVHDKQILSQEQEIHKIIKEGTFLSSYCPHCQQSLINEDDELRLTVINKDSEEGALILSPYLDVFSNKSTIKIPRGSEVLDLRCPQCSHSLIDPEVQCARCGSQAGLIKVSAMRELISFYICLRRGCHWHGISTEDARMIALEDSMEW